MPYKISRLDENKLQFLRNARLKKENVSFTFIEEYL